MSFSAFSGWEPGSRLLPHKLGQHVADPGAGHAEIDGGRLQRPQRHLVGDRIRRILHQRQTTALLDGSETGGAVGQQS